MSMVIEYNGHSFFETQKGYFLGSVSNSPKWLHRYVWECEKRRNSAQNPHTPYRRKQKKQ